MKSNKSFSIRYPRIFTFIRLQKDPYRVQAPLLFSAVRQLNINTQKKLLVAKALRENAFLLWLQNEVLYHVAVAEKKEKVIARYRAQSSLLKGSIQALENKIADYGNQKSKK